MGFGDAWKGFGDVVTDVSDFAVDPFGVTSKAGDLLAKDDDKQVPAKTLMQQEGWGDVLDVATAVMLQESGGDETATNGQYIGLMQMGLLHAGKYGIPADRDEAKAWLKNGRNNLRAARKLYNEAGWQPWEAFTSGAYRRHLGRNPLIKLRNKDTVGEGLQDAANAVTNPIGDITGAVTSLIGTLLSKDTWFRVGKSGLGVTLLVIGTGSMVFIVANSASNGKVGTAVKTVAFRKGK